MRTTSIIWKGSGAIGLRNLIPLAAGLCVGTALTTQSLAKKGGNDPGESSVPSVVEAPVDYELTELRWSEDQNRHCGC
jgi:hypothetical protein